MVRKRKRRRRYSDRGNTLPLDGPQDVDVMSVPPTHRTTRFEIDEKHSRSKCMNCGEPPTHDCVWADGRGRAWFCDKHWDAFKRKHNDIVMHRQVKDGEVEPKYRRGWRAESMIDELIGAQMIPASTSGTYNVGGTYGEPARRTSRTPPEPRGGTVVRRKRGHKPKVQSAGGYPVSMFAASRSRPVESIIDDVVSGALFDFAGYLTTREGTMKVGAAHNAVPMVDRLKAWSTRRQINLDNANVANWDTAESLIDRVLDGEDVAEVTTTLMIAKYPKPMGMVRTTRKKPKRDKRYITNYTEPQPIEATEGVKIVKSAPASSGPSWKSGSLKRYPAQYEVTVNGEVVAIIQKTVGIWMVYTPELRLLHKAYKGLAAAKEWAVQSFGKNEALQTPTSHPTTTPGGGAYSAMTARQSRGGFSRVDPSNPWRRRARRRGNSAFNKQREPRNEATKVKAKWVKGRGDTGRGVDKWQLTGRKADRYKGASWSWLKSYVKKSTSEYNNKPNLFIQVLVWDTEGQPAHDRFKQVFTPDSLAAAKSYARKLVEDGLANLAVVEGRFSDTWSYKHPGTIVNHFGQYEPA